jgi:putative aminopeptidase FrvX
MNAESLTFLKNLMDATCPSGYEQNAQRLVRRRMERYADSITTDVHGNVIMALNKKAPLRVMLAGHIDEIGFMITHIDEKGYAYAAAVGGIDESLCAGRRIVIHGRNGPVKGVFGKKPIHLMSPDDRKKVAALEDLWIDMGARNKRDADKMVAVGDIAVYDCAFDDRIGAFVVCETLRLLAGKRLKVAVYGVTTVQEEVGLRGARTSAFSIDPHVGIAIDVGFATDHPTVDPKKHGTAELGKGPMLHRGPNINPVVDRLLEKAAKTRHIPHQYTAEPRATGTDANAMQVNRGGVAAALISIPNRYMHTPVEAVHLKDVENTAKLLAGFIEDLKPEQSFIPR